MKPYITAASYIDFGMRLSEARLAEDRDAYVYRLSKGNMAIKFYVNPLDTNMNELLTMCTYRLKLALEYPGIMLLADEDDHGNGD